MKPYRRSLFIATGLALSTTATAQVVPTQLDDVTVTATRTAQSIADSVVPIEVIDRAQIQRSQAISVLDLLRGRAGLDFTNQGGLGKLTSVFLRGTASNQLLVLVDGVRMGAASNGMPALQDLPLEQIERVEIVRGPRSSLYGAEAMGGVIQIFTRSAGTGTQQNLALTAGSHGLRGATAGFSHRGTRGWVSAQGGVQRSDGINACRGTSAGWGAGCYVEEPDRDGYRNVSLNLRAGYRLSDTLALEAHLLDAHADNEYDGAIFGGNEAKNLQQVYGSTLTWTANEQLRVTGQLARSRDEAHSRYVADGVTVDAGAFDNRRDSASVQADWTAAPGQQLSAGVDFYEDQLRSSTAYVQGRRDNTGVFVQYQGQFGAHALQASVRSDDNEQFGNHTTGSVGYGLALGHGLRVTASAGTGFKAPTFNDLYYPGFSNPALKPEQSKSINLGLAQYADHWHWTFNIYDTRIDELIGYDSSFNIINVNKARIRGAEVTGAWQIDGWEFNAQASVLDPRDDTRTSFNYDNVLVRRARSSGRLDIDKAVGPVRLGATASAYGHRYDDAANSVRLAGYGTLDLRVELPLGKAWTLQARASNVFDRQYETIAWFNQPGREYQLSVRYRSAD